MQNVVIDAKNVGRAFNRGALEVKALQGVCLQVLRGEMLAIMGASGSGKSTLMNILGCLDYSFSGVYVLDGVRVNGMSRDALADVRNQKVGFVFQGFNLLGRTTALENVELPLLYRRHQDSDMDTRQEAMQALARVGLAERLYHTPSELSGGQQQRVAIARALVSKPAILLADEPTGNLDTRTSLEVLSLFQALNQEGVTIVLVTHEHEVMRYTQRVIELRDGRIVLDAMVDAPRSAHADLLALDMAVTHESDAA